MFEEIKKIGIEKIHKETRIPLKILRAILEKDFGKFDKTAFFGFVKIIERDFGISLEELKEEAKEYFAKQETNKDSIFVPPKQKKKNINLFLIALIMFILFFGWQINSKKHKTNKVQTNNNNSSLFFPPYKKISLEQKREENFSKAFIKNEQNVSETKEEEINSSDIASNNITSPAETQLPKAFIPDSTVAVFPKQRVWVGEIFLNDFSKKSFFANKFFEINSTIPLLLVLGHGMVKIKDKNGEKEPNRIERVRFLIKNSEAIEINESYFRKLNRGKSW